MKFVAPLFIVLSLFAVSCGSDGASGSGSSDGLIGQWLLTGGTLDGDEFPLADGWRVTMTLDVDGELNGTAACNGYGGTYALDGSTLTFGGIRMTEMGCEPQVMASEAAFLQVLQREVQLERAGTELVMQGHGVDLTFALVPAVEPSELVGTTWVLDTVIKGESASSVQGEPLLVLDPDGTFTGSTGCREVSGSYVINGDALIFPDMRADGECPTDLERQDSDVISVLENAQIEITENRLTLTTAGNEGLGYRAG